MCSDLPEDGLPHPPPLVLVMVGECFGLLGLLAGGVLAGPAVEFGEANLLVVVTHDDPAGPLEVAARRGLVGTVDEAAAASRSGA